MKSAVRRSSESAAVIVTAAAAAAVAAVDACRARTGVPAAAEANTGERDRYTAGEADQVAAGVTLDCMT